MHLFSIFDPTVGGQIFSKSKNIEIRMNLSTFVINEKFYYGIVIFVSSKNIDKLETREAKPRK